MSRCDLKDNCKTPDTPIGEEAHTLFSGEYLSFTFHPGCCPELISGFCLGESHDEERWEKKD